MTEFTAFLVKLDTVLSSYEAIAYLKANKSKYVKERHPGSIVKSGTWLWLSCRLMQLRFDLHDAIAGRKPGYHFNKPLNGK